MAKICSRLLATDRWCRRLHRPNAVLLTLGLVLVLLGLTYFSWQSAGRAGQAWIVSHPYHSGWPERNAAFLQGYLPDTRHRLASIWEGEQMALAEGPGERNLHLPRNQQSLDHGDATIAPTSHPAVEISELGSDPKSERERKGDVALGRSVSVVDVVQESHLGLGMNASASGSMGPSRRQHGALKIVPVSGVQNESVDHKAKEEATPGSWTQQTMVRVVDGALVHSLESTKTTTTNTSAAATVNGTVLCDEIPFGCSGQALLAPFKPAMTKEELCLLLTLMQALAQALDQAGISYFLYGGTLLGSWRYHGLVPWDDDIDVAVDFSRVEDLRKVLQNLSPTFRFVERHYVSWKFFSAEGGKRVSYSAAKWTWPFIDICFYDLNVTHVADHDLKTFPEYVFPRDWVLPLVLRPFHGLLLPAPRRTGLVLRHTYNVSQCAIGVHSHRLERGRPREELKTLDCRQLEQCYPKVERRQVRVNAAGDGGGGVGTSPTAVRCNETTVWGGVVRSWGILDDLDECLS